MGEVLTIITVAIIANPNPPIRGGSIKQVVTGLNMTNATKEH